MERFFEIICKSVLIMEFLWTSKIFFCKGRKICRAGEYGVGGEGSDQEGGRQPQKRDTDDAGVDNAGKLRECRLPPTSLSEVVQGRTYYCNIFDNACTICYK